MVNMSLEAMERTGRLPVGKPPVLFVLDELAALGHMENIEKAAGQIAGFGVKLWAIVQDLTQLKRDYNDAWETFLGNAGLLAFFGNSDLTTLEHISRRLGPCETISTVINMQEGTTQTSSTQQPDAMALLLGQGVGQETAGENRTGNRTETESLARVPLLHPDEIARLFRREAGNILVFAYDGKTGPGYYVLNRARYFGQEDDPLFGGLFDPLPGEQLRTNAAQRQARDQAEAAGP
jgi:type IV secretion system protein VirD4